MEFGAKFNWIQESIYSKKPSLITVSYWNRVTNFNCKTQGIKHIRSNLFFNCHARALKEIYVLRMRIWKKNQGLAFGDFV
ncbi:hypothetical protein Pfo_016016 [Paulownia fortunei]|nr:hypothetical protein Pfo_016016 [Paulownia fortunei]